MFERLSFFMFSQEHPPSDDLLRFDFCRRYFEKRLTELDEEIAERFSPIADWMRLVIAEKAPELLNESYWHFKIT
ncbi:MAG: hypothetical protein ACFFB3_00345 [Candidatus Hodarchaeota archaeon]